MTSLIIVLLLGGGAYAIYQLIQREKTKWVVREKNQHIRMKATEGEVMSVRQLERQFRLKSPEEKAPAP